MVGTGEECERLLCGGGFAPPTQEVGCGGMSNPGCAVLVAMFVDFWWLVKISWRVHKEQDGADPSSPASGQY